MIDLSSTVRTSPIFSPDFPLFCCYFSFISIFGSTLYTLKTVTNIVENNLIAITSRRSHSPGKHPQTKEKLPRIPLKVNYSL
jgi:hypothetical protein